VTSFKKRKLRTIKNEKTNSNNSSSRNKWLSNTICNFVQKELKMDLQSRKISFIQDFLRLQNEEIISRLEEMLKKQKAELYKKELKPMSAEQFNSEIDQSLEDSVNDRVTSSNDLKSEIKKWS
jgi:hypothetical protein